MSPVNRILILITAVLTGMPFATPGQVIDYSYPVALKGITYGTSANEEEAFADGKPEFKNNSESKTEKPLVRLVAGYDGDTTSFDPLVIYYDEKATCNFDGQLDALKLFNTDYNITNFYSLGNDGSRLSINALPLVGDTLYTVGLGLKTGKEGEVIFRIKDIVGIFADKNISISDVYTGTNQPLFIDNYYRINLPAGDYQNRFFLNISTITTDIPDFTSTEDFFNVYSSHGSLKADINLPAFKNGILAIYNIMGQILYTYNISEPGFHEFYPVVKDGIYIVSFKSGNIRHTKKIYIHG